ncbi:NUDIX domain-containing protein [Streptomyces sp. 150FB]|uniref:NUDIX hydrolase n=1 Tax=Streptomyces sp. 150FB TaxID=1576605 RepID=UPI000B1A5F06|nr:NUDIX domain-containing protein [Streptomyces sp. 150FB]
MAVPRGLIRARPEAMGDSSMATAMDEAGRHVAEALSGYTARDAAEAADVARVRALVSDIADPWPRTIPLHVTASAVIVHPGSGRVLLRWHEHMRSWLHVGGHGDPGESDPLVVALREGAEETGLTDLTPWPDSSLVQVVVVSVPAKGDEPAHEHADLRYVLATDTPEAARAERPGAPLRWLLPEEARRTASEGNIREALARVETLLAP